jgi:holo-[acyl-carrier protein] synthase|tara:strand:- start:1737 stop:2117 length:381 start_codon:yes stop_codon:yes gene_type:complete
MICGIGTDIVDLNKFKALQEKWGYKLIQKVLTTRERKYCLKHKNSTIHIAARFAAKESVVKALDSVFEKRIDFKDIEITREKTGRPGVAYRGEIKKTVAELGVSTYISISHSGGYASAVAVVELNE